jgi:dihydroorotate dehydrogenase
MKPWLWIPTQMAHSMAPFALQTLSAFRESMTYSWMPLDWRGLHFANRLGIAGGVDKDGDQIEDWWTFGPGFIEVGTVTPLAQEANPGRIIARDTEARALWNRMGFPGAGVEYVRQNLSDLPLARTTPVFVNIGRNRSTPNETAARDYSRCIEELSGYADAFVVNISSPNTSGLRDLLLPANLRKFLGKVLSTRNKSKAPMTPVLLKLSPDLEESDLANAVSVSVSLGIDGFITTNTTLERAPGSTFPTEGGVSGAPLADRSKEVLRDLIRLLGPARKDKLLISAGGVMTPEDVFERLSLGADLVQVYTALIYDGPFFFSKVADFMTEQSRFLASKRVNHVVAQR